MDRHLQNNKLRSIFALALRTAALLACTGPIMQTFLASLGFSSQFIYINTTIVQLANILTSFLCAQWADRGSVIKRSAICEVPHAILYLLYIPLCLWKSTSFTSFAILTGICLLQSVCIALYTVCEYKLPYFIYGPKDYGTVLAISGIVSSLISLGAGLLITRLASRMDYSQLMLWACVISFFMMGLSALLHVLQKPIAQPSLAHASQTGKVNLLSIFRRPVFYRMIPANLLRGFGYGTTTIMAGIALDLGYGQSISTALVSVQSAAMLLGCGLFALSVRYLSPRTVMLAGSVTFLLLPLMLIPNPALFLILFSLVFFGRTLVDYAAPSLLRMAVPVEVAGPYNAWRMILHFTGTILATSVAALIPVWLLLLLTMLAQLISGIHYFSAKEMRIT
ncbi:MAG: hypothetical protein IJN20_06465 [Oscillospiraceae bacterium]|nr:hypothetical protein [Oscillospiraceae bacterium]